MKKVNSNFIKKTSGVFFTLLCIFYLNLAWTLPYKQTLFNDHFLTLEKYYGNISEIEHKYYCLDQEVFNGMIDPDSITKDNFFKAINKDIVIDGSKTPNIRPCVIKFENNNLTNIRYLGASSKVSIEFLYDDKAAGYTVKIGDNIEEKIKTSSYDNKNRPTSAKNWIYWGKGKQPSMSSIKSYEYDESGYCIKIIHSCYWTSEYKYDKLGFIQEMNTTTSKGSKITKYKILETDTQNNWTKRFVVNDGKHCNYIEERKITYL